MKKNKGFTLVELLVVISIIALLMAILVPGLSMCRELARRIVCSNIMKTFGQANMSYVNAWGGYYIPFGYPSSSPTGPPVIQWIGNPDFRKYIQLQSYAKGDEIGSIAGGAVGNFTLTKEFECPSHKSVKKREEAHAGEVMVSYGCNITDWGGNGSWIGTWVSLVGYKQEQVKNPSEKLMYSETPGDWWVSWKGADYERGWDVFGDASTDTYKDKVKGGRGHGATVYRHSEGSVILFYDAHVDHLKKQEIYVHKDWDATPKRPGIWSVINPTKYE